MADRSTCDKELSFSTFLVMGSGLLSVDAQSRQRSEIISICVKL